MEGASLAQGDGGGGKEIDEMTLRETQSDFAHMVAKLILHAEDLGFDVTLGDAYRDPRAPYGHPKSLHRKRLAIDLNLFKDGKYLRSTEAHRELGEWWEKQHLLARWGGRFEDANHYSFTYGGMK